MNFFGGDCGGWWVNVIFFFMRKKNLSYFITFFILAIPIIINYIGGDGGGWRVNENKKKKHLFFKQFGFVLYLFH